MDLEINLVNENIIVSELCDDLVINNVPVMYDSDSSYMFCKIEALDTNTICNNEVSVGDILVVRRYSKEAFLSGYYFISEKDVRGIIKKDSYNKIIAS